MPLFYSSFLGQEELGCYQQVLVPGFQESQSYTKCFNAKPIKKKFSNEIQLRMRIRHPHVPTSKALRHPRLDLEGRTYDLGFLSRFTFKRSNVQICSKPILSWRMTRGCWSEQNTWLMSAFPTRSWAISMAVYSPFSDRLSAPKNYIMHPHPHC